MSSKFLICSRKMSRLTNPYYASVARSLNNVHEANIHVQESKAGLAVGKLRHHESKAVADVAKDLVKKWKAEVDAAKAKGTPKSTCTSPQHPL